MIRIYHSRVDNCIDCPNFGESKLNCLEVDREFSAEEVSLIYTPQKDKDSIPTWCPLPGSDVDHKEKVDIKRDAIILLIHKIIDCENRPSRLRKLHNIIDDYNKDAVLSTSEIAERMYEALAKEVF